MQTHKTTVTIDEKHQIVLRLPPDFPAGEADVIVSSDHTAEGPAAERLRALDELIDLLPPVPALPLSAFDREIIYR